MLAKTISFNLVDNNGVLIADTYLSDRPTVTLLTAYIERSSFLYKMTKAASDLTMSGIFNIETKEIHICSSDYKTHRSLATWHGWIEPNSIELPADCYSFILHYYEDTDTMDVHCSTPSFSKQTMNDKYRQAILDFGAAVIEPYFSRTRYFQTFKKDQLLFTVEQKASA
jgi:hypothetical protein